MAYIMQHLEKANKQDISKKSLKERLLSFLKSEKVRSFVDDFTTSISPQILCIFTTSFLIIFCSIKLCNPEPCSQGLYLFFLYLFGVVLLCILIILFALKCFMLIVFKIFPKLKEKIYKKIRMPVKYSLYLSSVLILLLNTWFFLIFYNNLSSNFYYAMVFFLLALFCYFCIYYEKRIISYAKIYIPLSLILFFVVYIAILLCAVI